MALLEQTPLSRSEIAAGLGHAGVSGSLNTVLPALLNDGLIQRTIPDRPGSRLQKYKLIRKGRNRLARAADEK